MNLWLNRSEAGAAAYGTTVLASAGCLNRTFVLLFLNSHLNSWPPGGADGEQHRQRAGGALTMFRSNLIHLFEGRDTAAKCSTAALSETRTLPVDKGCPNPFGTSKKAAPEQPVQRDSQFRRVSSRMIPSLCNRLSSTPDRAFTPFEEISDAVIVIQGSKISAVGQRGKVDLPRWRARDQRGRKDHCAGLCRCPHSRSGGTRRDGRHPRGAGNHFSNRRGARHNFPGGNDRNGQRKGNARQRGGHRALYPQYEPISHPRTLRGNPGNPF